MNKMRSALFHFSSSPLKASFQVLLKNENSRSGGNFVHHLAVKGGFEPPIRLKHRMTV
jgi:hypothetical protein